METKNPGDRPARYPQCLGSRTGAGLRSAGPALLFICLGLALTAGGGAESEGDAGRLSLTGVRSLTVEGAYFAVEIRGGAGAGVEARFEIPERLRKRGVRVLHEQTGTGLRVWVERPDWGINLTGLKTPRLIFEVPVGTEVRVANSSGPVYLAGLETDRVVIELSSGRCEVEDVNAALEVTSTSGSLAVRNCDGDKTLKASSGKISVRDAGGDIQAVTSSGSQTYAGITGSIAAEASSGAIAVTDQVGTLDLRASSGSLSGQAITLTGASTFTTSSGAIAFDFSNDLQELSFDLRSSSGMIRVGDTRARGTVVMGGGPILLRGTSSSGSQSYR
jgi:hypothetical protein